MPLESHAADAPLIPRIQHVTLELSEDGLERAREFWRICGFEEVEPPADLKGESVWFEAGAPGNRTQVHLLFREERGSDEAEAVPGYHVAIVAPRFEQQVADLRAAGFPVRDRNAYWGAPRVFAQHPGGHTVELMAFPPPEHI